MDLLDVENDIIDELEANITGIEIKAFPADPNDIFKSLHPVGAVLLRYDSSDYTVPVPNRTKTISQVRTARWVIWILYKNLSGHNENDESDGIYVRLKQVREALTGYTIGTQSGSAVADASVMYPVRDNFMDWQEGKWIHEIVFEHTVPEVEA